MSGLFSQELVKLILHGPFQSSPIVIDVQSQEPGTPDKLRICQHLSKSSKLHVSVNSYMRKEEFPTRFDMISKVADIVSIISTLFSPQFCPANCAIIHPFAFCSGDVFFLLHLQFGVFASLLHYLGHLVLLEHVLHPPLAYTVLRTHFWWFQGHLVLLMHILYSGLLLPCICYCLYDLCS